MSTKNGKKSRNRRHEEPNFKPPPHQAIDQMPKQNLRKHIVVTEPESEIINLIAVNIVEPNSSNGNGNSAKDSKGRSRSNTPQSGKKVSLNNGGGNSKSVEEDNVMLANGGNEYEIDNGGGDVQVDNNDEHLSGYSADNLMEPLILDGNEPEPELLHIGDSDSPDQQQLEQDDPVKNSPNLTRCTTRRSQTRYIPTPETPHSFASGGEVVEMVLEGAGGGDVGGEETIGHVIQVDEEILSKTNTNTRSSTPTRTEQSDCTLPTTIILSSPPTLTSIPTQSTIIQQQSFETSSSHSDTNLSDAATDNCSTHAVVGSDITRMNIEHLTLSGDNTQNDLEEDIYAEIAVDREEERPERVDSRDSGYNCGTGDSADERPRRREGSIARALTGRRSIRPGTDYRKYLLERGMSSSGIDMEGCYSATLGREATSATSSSGIKRKTLSTEFSTSTPTTLKRRKLDTPQATISWFSYLAQPLYSLKNRLTRFNTFNTELPQTNTTPKLTGYKTKTNLEQDTVDTYELNQFSDEDETNEGNVSLGIEAMEYEGGKVEEGVGIPVALEVEGDGTASNRKSCAIM